jgi:D-sedoheptulose 7-phosphate isomerase
VVFKAARDAIALLSPTAVTALGQRIKKASRVFTVGLGGSAAHASHCACDLVKLGGVEAHCLVDNVSALTAGFNDDGSEVFVEMLRRFRFDHDDLLLVFSVGGGDLLKGVSVELDKPPSSRAGRALRSSDGAGRANTPIRWWRSRVRIRRWSRT